MTVQRAYFISDAHLGARIPSHEHRESCLLSFLETTVKGSSHLFLVGDLFDFWIEYGRTIRSDYFPAVHALRGLVDSGTQIHYLAGNHDFALGPFLSDTIGIHIHPDSLDLTLQDKKLHIFHGDGLVKADVAYRILRRILRNPACQGIYRMLHPTAGIALAEMFSGSSRKLLSLRFDDHKLGEYRAAAGKKLASGNDIVVFAHTHAPEILRQGSGTYCNTGNWIRDFSFAKLEDGAITLWKYALDGAAQQIQPSEGKWGDSES